MLALAALDSHVTRCLLSRSLQLRFTRPVLIPLIPSPTTSLPSNHRNLRSAKSGVRDTIKKALRKEKSARQFREEAQLSSKEKIPDLSLPEPPSRSEVAQRLRAHVTLLADRIQLTGRIAGWGLRGDVMKSLMTSLSPDDDRCAGSPRRIIEGLMDFWSAEALAALEGEEPNSSPFWDLENIEHAITAEKEGDMMDRECINSFLLWLERKLEPLPDSSRLLAHLRVLLSVADMRFAPLKYPTARSLTRHIHLHVGPTNSGKTHGALLALCKANTGLYAGPLRLLAHEVWDRVNSGTVSPGVPPRACNLKTGEEVKVTDELAGLMACTVEMVSLSRLIDVAVIDEIQMIGDPQRGHAWTTAVLGIPAKEMHLCGESSVIPLIKRLAEACGDIVHIHEYKRLTPLKVGEPLDGDSSSIQKGDCIVAFSRSEIFRLKKSIEEMTPLKCALAYGALPPETKSDQAKIFNDPENEVSVMVASDAIGMGLNLKIKRIIFSSINKWNGSEMVPISASQIKQIAGRAGRYGTTGDQEEGGLVTTLNSNDLPILEAALLAPLRPITRAAIQPSSDNLALLSTTLPIKKKQEHSWKGKPREMLFLLEDLQLLTRIDSSTYFASSMEQQHALAPHLEDTGPMSVYMTIAERQLFALSPANIRDERLMALLSNMVGYHVRADLVSFEKCDTSLGMLAELRAIGKLQKKFGEHIEQLKDEGKGVQDEESRMEALGYVVSQASKPPTIDSLMILESLHRGLTLYLWLSFRLPLAFCYRKEVEADKAKAESAISFCLEAIKAGRAVRLAKREKWAAEGEERQRKRAPPKSGVRQSSRPTFGGQQSAQSDSYSNRVPPRNMDNDRRGGGVRRGEGSMPVWRD